MGWTHDEAADAMGMSRGGFIKLERGERKLHDKTIERAAKAFGVAMAEIISDEPPMKIGGEAQRPAFGERDLRVYAAVEGGVGEMVVSTEPIDLVPRPWFMREVRDGYAVLVVGESMVPVYDPGDMVIINPRLPPMRGKDVILVANDEQRGEFRASLKRLLSWTATEWHLCQFNPPHGQKKEFTLSRKDWPKALRVVGKYSGG